LLNTVWKNQISVAEIVCHHERVVERGEIEGGDRMCVVATGMLDNDGAFVLVTSLLYAVDGDEQTMLFTQAVKL
jgi:hypothetical protein